MADIHKPLAIVVHIAVVLGIVYLVARSVLFFAFGPDEAAPVAADAVGRRAVQEEPPVDQIADLHLFGKPPAAGVARPIDETERLRETPLSLVLHGVFVADEAAASTALIASKGRAAEAYNVGDRIPGNARLEEVYWDRVVIRRGRVSELIRFEEKGGFVVPRSTSAPQDAADIQARAQNDPRQLLADLGVGQVSGDGEGGYTIGSLADRPQLSHTGLQRGDRVLSVNGLVVGNPEEDRLRIEDIIAQGSASLEIQRGERRFVVTVSLN